MGGRKQRRDLRLGGNGVEQHQPLHQDGGSQLVRSHPDHHRLPAAGPRGQGWVAYAKLVRSSNCNVKKKVKSGGKITFIKGEILHHQLSEEADLHNGLLRLITLTPGGILCHLSKP